MCMVVRTGCCSCFNSMAMALGVTMHCLLLRHEYHAADSPMKATASDAAGQQRLTCEGSHGLDQPDDQWSHIPKIWFTCTVNRIEIENADACVPHLHC